MAQLTTRTGTLGRRLAAHLLRRTTYQVTPTRIEEFAQKTAEQAVNELLSPASLLYPNGPLYWGNDLGEGVGNPVYELGRVDNDSGEIYNVVYEPDGDRIVTGRLQNPNMLWRVYECIDCSTAHWKIAIWFASLFIVDAKKGVRYNYHYWRLMHHLAFDNLKQLAFKVTTDNHMLVYLDNNQNRASSPNENYAREFLELFTILKGEVIGVGNYTNYTEADISTAAKVLTGFRINLTNTDADTGINAGVSSYNLHDTTDKTFSAAFQNTTITGAVDADDMYRELEDFVDMVFNQLETAKAYVRKMYLFFVSDIIDEEIETDVITPLANTLLSNGYQHIPVLSTLLKSVHFYDEDDSDSSNEIIGGKIKSPMEMFCTSINLLEIENSDQNDLDRHFRSNGGRIYNDHFRDCGMDLRGPITVEGYPGNYDSPSYSRNWFSTNFLYERFTYGVSFRRGKVRETNSRFPYQMDIVQWTSDNIDDPTGPGTPTAPIGAADASLVVNDMLTYFLPEMPTGDRYVYFEQRLLGGLSPINWYFNWTEYLDTAEDSSVRVALERIYDAIMSSPEFQTF
jgi:hypothetical protein